jgi:regulator of sigma E protease
MQTPVRRPFVPVPAATGLLPESLESAAVFNALPPPLNSAVPFVIVLGVLVFFHELGHYLAARWRGVHVEAFSVGFGRALVSWTDKRGTNWKIAWIPLGGYVKLHGQEQPADVGADVRALWQPGRTFHEKQVGSRAIVVAAGPVANFVLAAILFALLFATSGEPVIPPILYVTPDSPAAHAGLRTGDRVEAIEDRGVRRFDDIDRILSGHPGQPTTFHVRRGEQTFAIAATPDAHGFGTEPLIPAEIGGVVANSAAARAGLMAGDRVGSIDGEAVQRFDDIRRIVSARPAQKLVLGIQRAGAPMTIALTTDTRTEDGKTIGSLGVQADVTESVRLGPVAAAIEGVTHTYDVVVQTVAGLWGMIAGGRGAEELGGPLRIAQMSGEVAQLGAANLINFIAVLSVNLGLINLFPIPVLDGGHLLFYLAEAVRGRPLPRRAVEYGFRAGFALLVGLFVFATWNDLSHLGLVRWVRTFIG